MKKTAQCFYFSATFCIILIIFLASISFADSWLKYRSEEYGFEMLIPSRFRYICREPGGR